MRTIGVTSVCVSASAALVGCSRNVDPMPREAIVRRDVAARLDTLHDAASKADGPRYWSCFAPDAVFLGTDATERWALGQFKDYADARFAEGKGWTYTVLERHIHSNPESRHLTAWFDERLMNAKYGECRGTGVLVCRPSPPDRPDQWLIVQYNLTVPVPNDLLPEVAGQIRRFQNKGQ